MSSESEVYSFGRFRLDVRLQQLARDGEEIALQRRVFDLLLYLIRHRDRILTKDELQDTVWADTVVSETALTRAVMKARRALDDDGAEQQWIRTQHGRGYRFVGEVVEEAASTRAAAIAATRSVPEPDARTEGAADPGSQQEGAEESAAVAERQWSPSAMPSAPAHRAAAAEPDGAEPRLRHVLRVLTAYGAFAWLLNQIAALGFEAYDWPRTWQQLLLAATFVGALPVAAFGWSLALAAHGDGRGAGRSATSWLSASAILMLSIALAVSLFWNLRPTAEPAAPPAATVAVLPFVSLSRDETVLDASEGFAAGLREAYAAIPDLRVLARVSSAALSLDGASVVDRARALGVTHLVEGSVQQVGDALTIRAALLDGADGTQLWNARWTIAPDEFLGAQHRVAREAVDAWLERSGAGAEVRAEAERRSAQFRSTDDLDAFRAHLQAERLRLERTVDSVSRARTLYEQALELDPGYAEAWAGLAMAELTLALFGVGERAQGMAAAREAARTAIAYDGNRSLPWRALADIEFRYGWDFTAGARHMETALELAPQSPDVMASYASVLSKLGRHQEAADLAERAWQLDPLNAAVAASRTIRLIRAERFEAADAALGDLLALAPEHGDRHWIRAQLALDAGDPAVAIEAIAADELEYLRLTVTAIARHRLGDVAGSDADLARLVDTDADGAAFQIAEIHAARGEADAAFEWLDRAFAQRDPGVAELLSTPAFRNLAGDARFAEVRGRLGL